MTAPIQIALATSSVFPEPADRAFALAADLGCDGVEVTVGIDAISQDVDALQRLSDQYAMPVIAIHSPCLIVTQRVWGAAPWGKLERSRQAALRLGATVVVVHPPFAWQRQYVRTFRAGLAELAARPAANGVGEPLADSSLGSDSLSGESGTPPPVRFAVENMFPISVAGVDLSTYRPDWRIAAQGAPLYPDVTLDVSHMAASASDALQVLRDVGSALRHVHLADGTAREDGGAGRDEHLVPGRGTQPCAEVLHQLVDVGYRGAVVLEINTRTALSPTARRDDLAQSVDFARAHLAAQRR